MEIPDIATWAESPAGFYLQDTKKPIILADHQKDILLHCFTPDAAGRLPYDTIVYSCPKKSGKTTLAALVAEYFALFIEAPNEIYVLANSLEQSQGRAFKSLATSVKLNKILARRTKSQKKDIRFDNGTDVIALSSEFDTAAGSNHGLTIWDELWAYLTENARRLWDEMTGVPTRKISTRFVVTYAGFTGESKLLEELYEQGKTGEVVPELAHIGNGEGQAACRHDGRTFVYWDHELKNHPGLTITPEEYHERQRKDLRPLAFLRLHENRFTSNESVFVTPEQWQACFSPELHALTDNDPRKCVFGADASTSRDHTSLVGVHKNRKTGFTEVAYVKTWKPVKGELRGGRPTVDLDEGLGKEVFRLHKAGHLRAIYADPYQLHTLIVAWDRAGIKVIELPQTTARTEADQALYDAIINKTLRHYDHPTLTEHVKNAVAVETARGFRLAKEKTSKKIDGAVSLSMAHYGAMETPEHSALPAQPMSPSKWLNFGCNDYDDDEPRGSKYRRF